MRRVAREAWLAAHEAVGNPSSLHHAGRKARSILDDSREQLAALLGAHPTEVVLTSGATEANNLAVKGLFWSRRANQPQRTRIITSSVEHHAALDPARWLVTAQDAGLVELPVGLDARVDVAALTAALAHSGEDMEAGGGDEIALVSLQWVNNEVGTVQPVAEAVRLADSIGVPVHSDAAQAAAYLSLDFAASGLATMALSAHKVGGPIGVGALLVRRDVTLTPVSHGGGQQRARSGTLDAAGAAGFAAALAEAVDNRASEAARLWDLRTRLVHGVAAAIPDARVSGPVAGPVGGPVAGPGEQTEHQAPHITHIWFPGASAEAMLFGLDQRGIEVSTGSACTAGVVDASHVMLAMGHTDAEAAQALRVSFGHTTVPEDVEALLAALPEAVARARA
jgi:cysteine desulfurase